ncbi:MAG TPA: glycosyltransferase family 87 protein [Terriglobales bacterium]|nr:glycosyltransferase family 87 protein [Terriglobales bacterium]
MKIPGSRRVLLPAALLLGLAMGYYYYGLLLPLRRSAYHVTNGSPGNWSDLYPRWLGAREVLLHRRNPYSPEMTREIQRGFYGHVLDPSNPKEPTDQEGFAYPLYVVFLLAPSIMIPFPAVRAFFSVVLVLLALASIFWWVRGMRLRLSVTSSLLAVIAVMSSYPVLDAIHLQQFTLLVAALMAAAIAALAGNRLMLAGVLLACATIKPQLVFVLALGLVLWSIADWCERKSFLAGFGLTLLLLIGSAELLLPGWLGLWRQAGKSYLAYVRPSLLGSVLGPAAGVAAGSAAVLVTIVLFWRFRRHGPGSQPFNFLIVTALFSSTLVAPNAGSAKYNLALLVPACLWLFTFGMKMKTSSILGRFSWWLAANALLWQWLLALIVVIGVVAFRHPLQREATLFAAAPEILLFYFPLLLLPFLLSALLHLNKHPVAAEYDAG